MDYIYACILGIVEGVTEFLPVSSTGHLLIASDVLHLPQNDFWKSFIIAIQLGAMIPVLWMYAKKVLEKKEMVVHIVYACIPTFIVGFALYTFIKKFLFENHIVTLVMLCVGGMAMIGMELFLKRRENLRTEPLTRRKAFLVGLAQSTAVIPGVSRSAATILGGLSLGISRKEIVEFSFLIAVPTIAAATGYDILKNAYAFSWSDIPVLMVGMAVAGVMAYMAIRSFIAYVSKHTFVGFGVYRIVFALALWWILFA